MLAPDYPVRTARLVLRPFDPATDVDAVHAYASRPDVCRYISYSPCSRADIVERLNGERLTSIDRLGDGVNLAVVRRDTGALIGDVALEWTEADGCEISYVFNPGHHGHGFATEAAQALLRLAFEHLPVEWVGAWIYAANGASAGVLRRIGMTEVTPPRRADRVDYAITAAQWRARG